MRIRDLIWKGLNRTFLSSKSRLSSKMTSTLIFLTFDQWKSATRTSSMHSEILQTIVNDTLAKWSAWEINCTLARKIERKRNNCWVRSWTALKNSIPITRDKQLTKKSNNSFPLSRRKMSSRRIFKQPRHLLTNVQSRCKLVSVNWRNCRPRMRKTLRSLLTWMLKWLTLPMKNNKKSVSEKKLKTYRNHLKRKSRN